MFKTSEKTISSWSSTLADSEGKDLGFVTVEGSVSTFDLNLFYSGTPKQVQKYLRALADGLTKLAQQVEDRSK